MEILFLFNLYNPFITHPDIASLVDPLFAFGGKRVNKNIKNKRPSLSLAKERVVERSKDRVSNHHRLFNYFIISILTNAPSGPVLYFLQYFTPERHLFI